MRHLVIMMKEPVAGRVKTRLAADIGVIPATWWFRQQGRGLLRQVARDRRWRTWLAIAPDRALHSAALPFGVARIPQGTGDLGERMRRVFCRCPAGDVLIVGADIPGLSAAIVWDAFRVVRGQDAAFGAARDGGYWMVGLGGRRRMPAGFLRSVRWSTAHALADSVASLGPGARIGFARTLRDVDTGADLAAVRRAAR